MQKMRWNVERSKKEDCMAIAEFITITWNETYRGIVNDAFLDDLKNTEEKRKKEMQYGNFPDDCVLKSKEGKR